MKPIYQSSRVYDVVPQLARLREQVLLGDVWKQPEMTLRDRSLVTCSVLAALGKHDELTVHMRRAVENGVTLDELRGLIVQVTFYAGWPAGLGAGKAALPLLEGENRDAV
jgi:4-carboxymuconolactone decarboxylase